MLPHHFQKRIAVIRVPSERTTVVTGDSCRLGIRLTSHQRCDRRRIVPSLVVVIRHTAGHQQGSQIGIAEPKWSVVMAIFFDRRCWIARVINDHFLRRRERTDRGAEGLDIKVVYTILPLGQKLHEVQRREVARRIIEKHVL